MLKTLSKLVKVSRTPEGMATCVQVPFRASTASCTVMKEEGEKREGKRSKLKWGTLDPQGKITREEKEKQRKVQIFLIMQCFMNQYISI